MIGPQSQNRPAWMSRPILLIFPLLLLLASCNWQRGAETLPGQMVGEWRTDEPRYHERFMKLQTDRITFGLGGAAPDVTEHIENVRMAPSDNVADYTIRLRALDGTPDSIALLFTPQSGGELRLKSQPRVVWKRKADPAGTQPSAIPPPETPPREIPKSETSPPDGRSREHKTVYKIDCVHPEACHSY